MMTRRDFLQASLLALAPPLALQSESDWYRARVMYPRGDKYEFAAVERRFSSLKAARDWTRRYSGGARVVVDVKNLQWPEPSTLKEWAHRNRPKNCPAYLFKCAGV